MKTNIVWTRDNGPDGLSEHVLGTVEGADLKECGEKAIALFPLLDPNHPSHIDNVGLVDISE